MNAGSIGDFVVKAPMILGHESAGIVTHVGSNVRNVNVGDRVALEPGQVRIPRLTYKLILRPYLQSCRVCSECKIGNYELCRDSQSRVKLRGS